MTKRIKSSVSNKCYYHQSGTTKQWHFRVKNNILIFMSTQSLCQPANKRLNNSIFMFMLTWSLFQFVLLNQCNAQQRHLCVCQPALRGQYRSQQLYFHVYVNLCYIANIVLNNSILMFMSTWSLCLPEVQFISRCYDYLHIA